MSEIRVNTIKSEDGASPISFNKGINVSGVATATSFDGSATSAAGLTGTPDISVKGVNSTGIATAVMFSGNITGTAGTFSGDVSVRNITGVAATFSGKLSYEDVVNVDSIGIVTARSGVAVLGAGVTATGIGTFHSGLNLEDILAEEVNVTAGKLSDNTNIYLENGCVHVFTDAESTTSTPAIKYNASTNLKDKMSVGESVVVTLIT